MRTYDFEDSEVLRLHELGFRFDLVYRVWDPTRNFNFWNFISPRECSQLRPKRISQDGIGVSATVLRNRKYSREMTY
jgi:hypothetical protein